MQASQIKHSAQRLNQAMNDQKTLIPLTTQYPELTIDQAYAISLEFLKLRVNQGEKVVGKKIGLTSEVVQKMLSVHQPDFGFLMDKMQYPSGAEIVLKKELIQAKSEGEIAFKLKHDLVGPNVTADDVLAATEQVFACFEIVDSRIENWQIKIQDTIADNASCGIFVISEQGVDPNTVDFENCRMTITNKGEVIATGKGSAALGSPLNCVAWLANTLGHYDIPLKAGDIILSGSLAAMIPAAVGDDMMVEIEGVGSAEFKFI
ncbi:MAG: 2-oxopent-4-enoate/cis-2-oxohex-4-enoate hydratase [Paraglaciecola sp.]|jgi:2-oxopent-4-enoate/cis-2-oxohex-4-enoate hydratase